jgi:hypothetical protein
MGTASEAAKVNSSEKIQPHTEDKDIATSEGAKLESREVFQDTEDGVQFRNVSWQGATIIFLKIQFAMSILAVPGALSVLGAVGGGLSIVGWQALNTCL